MRRIHRPVVVARPPGTASPQVAGPGDQCDATVEGLLGEEVQLRLADGRRGLAELSDFANPPPAGGRVPVTVLLTDGDDVLCAARAPADPGDLSSLRPGTLVRGEVRELHRPGLRLDIGGVRGFAPASQLARTPQEHVPGQFQRNALAAEVISVDPAKQEIVVGIRRLLARRDRRRRDRALASLEEGGVVEGVITRLGQHGAFVDLGGVEGLLHESKIRRRLQDPEPPPAIEVGARIGLQVLHVDRARGRVSLAFPPTRAAERSWEEEVADYRPGERVVALVQETTPEGCSLMLEEGVVGWLPRAEFPRDEDEPSPGGLVVATIARIDTESHRIELRAGG